MHIDRKEMAESDRRADNVNKYSERERERDKQTR